MTNQVRGVVTREIGGARRELLLSANEWCELEDEFGKPTSALIEEFFSQVQAGELIMRNLRALFRAALSRAIPGITHEAAGLIMAELSLVESATLIGEVIIASMPKADEAAGPGKAKAPARKARA